MVTPIISSNPTSVNLKTIYESSKNTINSNALSFQGGFDKDKTSFTEGGPKKTENKPVTFGEGATLVGKGFLEKTKDLALLIINHPVKAIGVTALTALGIMALPLVGISSAVGASALALGFGGLALFNGVKHIAKAVKHSNEGDYNLLRDDLKNIGGECLDLALTLPFAPRAIKTVEGYIKHSKGIGINKELINGLKEAKGIGGLYTEFKKANLRVKYDVMAGKEGLKVKPELGFSEKMPFGFVGFYEPALGVIEINPYFLNPVNRMSFKATCKAQGAKTSISNFSPEGFLYHELYHFCKQFSNMARTENIGIQGLKENLMKYHQGRMPQLEEAIQQKRWFIPQIKEKLQEFPSPGNSEKLQCEAILKKYTNALNYFEKEMELSKAMLEPNSNTFNKAFYDGVVKEKGTIKASTKEAETAQKYLEGYLDKVNYWKNVRDYEGNALEAPAFKAQIDYIKNVINGRPGTKAAVVQANSAAL